MIDLRILMKSLMDGDLMWILWSDLTWKMECWWRREIDISFTSPHHPAFTGTSVPATGTFEFHRYLRSRTLYSLAITDEPCLFSISKVPAVPMPIFIWNIWVRRYLRCRTLYSPSASYVPSQKFQCSNLKIENLPEMCGLKLRRSIDSENQ